MAPDLFFKEDYMALYPHNQKTYKSIVKALNSGVTNIVIVQGTGVGKSFLAIELINQYFHDNNILYICPKECIEINIKKYSEFASIANRVSFEYNAAFNNSNLPEECLQKYDVFVIDECHHLGSDIQGANIRKIIDYCKTNSGKYCIGLTATPIREKDHNGKKIDVTEYFDCRIDGLSVFEAIEEGLMPPIEYLVCKPERYLTAKEKECYRQVLDIENSEELFRKIIDKNHKNSYLIFYSSIKEMNETTDFMKKLFPGYRILNISSDDNKSQTLLDTIKKNDKVIVQSVNMLLEGLHLPLMDCVILFRNTESFVVLQQIIGRISSIGNKKNPLFIDCTESGPKTLAKILYEQEKHSEEDSGNNLTVERERRPKDIIKISANNIEFFDLSRLFINNKNNDLNRKITVDGIEYDNVRMACEMLDIKYDLVSKYSRMYNVGLVDSFFKYYKKKLDGTQKSRIKIKREGKTFKSVRSACGYYKIPYETFQSYAHRNNDRSDINILFDEFINYYFSVICKKFTYSGKEYNDAKSCCRELGIVYESTHRYKRKFNISFQTAIYIECLIHHSITIDSNTYNNLLDLCNKLCLFYDKVIKYIAENDSKIEEAIKYFYNSNEDAVVIFGKTYFNEMYACKKLGIDYKAYNKYKVRRKGRGTETTIQDYINSRKFFIYHGIIYNTFTDAYEAMNFKNTTIKAVISRVYYYNITKQESLDYYCTIEGIIPPEAK